jgi:hypothetical protein
MTLHKNHVWTIFSLIILPIKAPAPLWEEISSFLTVKVCGLPRAPNGVLLIHHPYPCRSAFRKSSALKTQTNETRRGLMWAVGRALRHCPPTSLQPIRWHSHASSLHEIITPNQNSFFDVILSPYRDTNARCISIVLVHFTCKHRITDQASTSDYVFSGTAILVDLRDVNNGFSHKNVHCCCRFWGSHSGGYGYNAV